MGFSHYFVRELELDKSKYGKISRDVDVILRRINETGIVIAGIDGEGCPEINSEEICFNGTSDGNLAHEGFSFPRVTKKTYTDDYPSNMRFDFCKTCNKPYDIAVCSTLIIAKHHLGSAVMVESDGDLSTHGWKSAVELVQRTLGYGTDFQLDQ